MKNVRPTKEQYLKNIEHMQQKNLNSDTFKNAYEVVKEYLSRDNRGIEYKFLKLFNKFEREIEKVKYNNGDFGHAYKCYVAMRDFINELTDDVVESNCLLQKIKIAVNQGYLDSMKCVSEFISQVENYNGCGSYTIDLPLSKELSSSILDWMIISESMETPVGEELSHKFVDSLPDGYIGYYQKYNDLSRDGNSMIETILNYQMMMILASSPYGATVQLPTFSKTNEGNKRMSVDFLYVQNRKSVKKRELK